MHSTTFGFTPTVDSHRTRIHVQQIRQQKQQEGTTASASDTVEEQDHQEYNFPTTPNLDQEPITGQPSTPSTSWSHITDLPGTASQTNTQHLFLSDTESDDSSISSELNLPHWICQSGIHGKLRRPSKGSTLRSTTFLRHYNKLLKKCNVVDPQEQSEYIKSEEHYITPDWTLLQEEIRTYYDAEKVDQRYLPADLKTFAKRKARKACHTMGQWKTYYREYMAIAGNMGKNKIPDDKIDAYFWVGIEHHLQQELKTAINTKHPNRDKAYAPTMAQVKEAAEEYFKRDQFPATMMDAREFGFFGLHVSDSDNSDSSSSSTSTSDNDDSEEEHTKKWKRKLKAKLAKKKERTGKKVHKSSRHKEEAEVTREDDRISKVDPKTNDVEEIIERLNTMNIRDPHYGAVYYKAIRMDPLASKCIREPLKTPEPEPSFIRSIPPHLDNGPRQTWNAWEMGLAPTHASGVETLITELILAPTSRNPEICNEGWGTHPTPRERIFDPSGKQEFPYAGTQLEKQVMGYYWNTKKQQEHSEEEWEQEGSDNESDEEDELISTEEEGEETDGENEGEEEDSTEGSYTQGDDNDEDDTGFKTFQVWTDPQTPEKGMNAVYEAERTIPTTRSARKAVFDGVLMPPLRPRNEAKNSGRGLKTAEETQATAKKDGAKVPDIGKRIKTATAKPKSVQAKENMKDIPEQRPYDARKVRISPDRFKDLQDVDVDMGPSGETARESATRNPSALQHKTQRTAAMDNATTQRMARIAAEEVQQAYERCMNAAVTTTVGEMWKISKELRTYAGQRIKPKAPKAVLMTRDRRAMVAHVAEYPWSEEDGVLIKVGMEIGGKSVVAVIDTGSQLDVIREAVAERVLRQPIDLSQSIQMNDANGGESTLKGRVDGVSLDCGGVRTLANLYVSNNKVPFDLLLGRRWQRRNLVGIDERKNGTYLMFKDPHTHKNRHELKVHTERVAGTEVRNFRSLLVTHTTSSGEQETRGEGSIIGGAARIDWMEDGDESGKEEVEMCNPIELGLMAERPILKRKYVSAASSKEPPSQNILSILPSTPQVGNTWNAIEKNDGITQDMYKRARGQGGHPTESPLPSILASLTTSVLPSAQKSLFMTDDPRYHPVSLSCGRRESPLPARIPPCTTDVERHIAYNLKHVPSESATTTDSAIAAARISLPAYSILTDERSRMVQVGARNLNEEYSTNSAQPQFLNRDTYGDLPAVNRHKEDQSTYQIIYNAAADVRDQFARDEELACRPFAISAPQSEFLGTERDPNGRESLNFTALNACITGYDTDKETPFSIVGHLEVKIYQAPSNATTPWAMEAPYVSRLGLRSVLDNYEAYERPCFAFPDTSTSLRPCLDYLQPTNAHDHPSLLKPAGESTQQPNVPRIQYCTPPVEADVQEAGRAIHNSAIVHARWQPSAHYCLHEIPPASSFNPPHGPTWEFMGTTDTGAQRWREFLPDGVIPPQFLTWTMHRNDDNVQPFRDGIPEVPNDNSDGANHSTSQEPVSTPVEAIVVQIPDKQDRFSRPNQRARRSRPWNHAPPRPILQASYSAPDTDWSDSDAGSGESPPTSLLGEEIMELYGEELARHNSESEEAESDFDGESSEELASDEYDPDASPPLSPSTRPLETDDSYFPPQPIHPLERTRGLRIPPMHTITLSESEDDDSSSKSSIESVCSSMAGSGTYSLPELLYPPTPSTPSRVHEESQETPLPRVLSLTPVATPSSLINLPHTTPIPRSSPVPQKSTLCTIAQAALSGAERVLSGLKMTPRTPPTTIVLQEMEERIKGLERAHLSSQTPSLCNSSDRSPITSDKESAQSATSIWVEDIAKRLTESQVYRVEVEVPTIDTDLLLGFSKGITIPAATRDTFTRPFQQSTTAIRAPYTPCPSPIIHPHGRDLHTLDDDMRARTQSPVIPLSKEDMELIQDIFNLDDVEDEDLRVAGTWISRDQGEWAAEIAIEEAARVREADQGEELRSEPRSESRRGFPQNDNLTPADTYEDLTHGVPVSRRPRRNEDGEITYDRGRYGWHDFQNGDPPWLYDERRRDEAVGYALEFPDSALIQLHVKFRTKLRPNLHQQRLLHTEHRLKLEMVHARMKQRPHYGLAPLAELPEDVYPDAEQDDSAFLDDTTHFPNYSIGRSRDHGHHYASSESTTNLRPVTRYDLQQEFATRSSQPITSLELEQEHAARTQLSPVERVIPHYYQGTYDKPRPANCNGSFPDHDDQPTKRRKIQVPALGNQVVCAEAMKSTVLAWQAYTADLRAIRERIFFTIQRLQEVVEEYEGRKEFRGLFFPFDEAFPISSIREMYEMECACSMYFRGTCDFELAFILEELLSIQFQDDAGITQLLRGGFLTISHDFTGSAFNSSYGTLQDRFTEFDDHYAEGERLAI
ncbi:hypothetical protein C8R46DRAFT_1028992 [Mycena filopes]|nr:hypothetical protein C8R46DRAFT_1028992 [Mycena filopes]